MAMQLKELKLILHFTFLFQPEKISQRQVNASTITFHLDNTMVKASNSSMQCYSCFVFCTFN